MTETRTDRSCPLEHGDGLTGCLTCGQRMPARHRGFCDPECRQAWRLEHVWEQARLAALARACWTCSTCGATDDETILEVHHREPVDPVTGRRPGCQHHAEGLVCLCRMCHLAEHRALRAKPGEQLALVVAA